MKQYVCVIVTNKMQDTVLMMHKNRPYNQIGLLNFPGGGIEPGEPPKAAAVRELKEETGLDIPMNDLRPVGSLTQTRGLGRIEFYSVSLTADELAKAESRTDETITFREVRDILLGGDTVMEGVPLFLQLALMNVFYTVIGMKENENEIEPANHEQTDAPGAASGTA